MNPFSSLLTRGGLLSTLLLLTGLTGRAQAPVWQSAMVVGGANSNLAITATAPTASGDLYVAGGFSGIVGLGNTTLISTGGIDGFVAKWSPATNDFTWAYRFGGSDIDQVTALALNNGHLYLAGTFFSPTASFGSVNLVNYGGPNTVSTDAFVTRLTDLGTRATIDWAQQLGGPGQDAATTVVASGGSVYVGGSFASATASFGGLSLANSATGTATVPADGFVAKFTDAGTSASASWVRPVAGPGAEYVNALALDGSSVYATGYFGGAAATFGSSSLTNASATANTFVAKLTDAGTSSSWQWALGAGGSSRDVGNALAVRGSRVYVAGTFSSDVMTLGALTIANAGPSAVTTDAFLAAVTDAGSTATWTWALPVGGTGSDQGTVLATTSAGGLYLAGTFASAAVAVGNTALTTTTSGAMVTRLTDAGPTATVNWAQRGGATTNTDATCLANIGTRLFLAGSFQNTATFGSQTLASSSQGFATNFLATLTDPTITATAAARGGVAFTLAPNPAHGTTTVQLPATPGVATAALTLLDAVGRVVRTTTVALPAAGLRQPLELGGLPTGLYSLRVQAGAATGTQRLVVD
jgi:hypothetical protein